MDGTRIALLRLMGEEEDAMLAGPLEEDGPVSDALDDAMEAAPFAAPAANPRLEVVAAVVWRGDRVLFTQRPQDDPLGLQWEFPGGKIEAGESPAHAAVRELREELDVAAMPHEILGVTAHRYPHGIEVRITFVRCTLDSFEFRPSPAVHAVAWWRPREVDLERVLAADRDFIRGLRDGG